MTLNVGCAKSAKWIALRKHTHNITNGCGSAAPGFLQVAKTSGPKLSEFWPSHSVLGHANSLCFCHMANCKTESGPKFGHLWPITISTSLDQESDHRKPRNPLQDSKKSRMAKSQLFVTQCGLTLCDDNSRMANSPKSRSKVESP